MNKTSWPKRIICVALLSVMGASFAEDLRAGELIREIHERGPRQTVEKYCDTLLWGDTILPGIESAGDQWLNVATQLQSGADGGCSEDLDSALYAALPVRPFAVLRVLGKKYKGPVSYLCNVSFEAAIPDGGALAYLERVRRALDSASTKQQRAVAKECQKGLDQSRASAIAQGLH